MSLIEVREIAMSNGVKDTDLSLSELIKSIQINEGNFDCYGTAYDGECDQINCCWREDCFAEATKAAYTELH